jgi:transposase
MSTILNTVCLMAVAIEIAAKKWVVACTAGGKIVRKVLSEEQSMERLDALVAEVTRAASKLGLDPSAQVLVAYEAGQEGFWLMRALQERGIRAEVINPTSLQVDRRARRVKTDRVDAESLARALWRHMNGDHLALRMVHAPDEEAEDVREWQRERDRLMAQRRGCEDRIRKKLRTQGIWQLPRTWRTMLREDALRDWGGRPLGTTLRAMLQIELDRLEAAEAQIATLQQLADRLGSRVSEQVEQLSALCGVGPVGARGLALRLLFRKFKNPRQVGSCVGLVGTPYDSGTMRKDQGISKQGDPRLRALLVELAWMWLRYQPESSLSRWFVARTSGSGPRNKRVMIVALARKLAIALWRYVENGVIPEGAKLKRQYA